MNEPVDRALIERLLENNSLSYREIARRAGCSDWSARSIARHLNNDPRPMKARCYEPDDDSDESWGLGGWIIIAGLGAAVIGALWWGMRGMPPPESDPMQ
ncbi:MAG: helix-turn-helix domain-containing protein [Firmicutes bacterium]|nr:helix-turn-helix domain-containing protein [Bacillota bacterium]